MESLSSLSGQSVLDPEGRAVPLGSLWSNRPVVLALVRQFG